MMSRHLSMTRLGPVGVTWALAACGRLAFDSGGPSTPDAPPDPECATCGVGLLARWPVDDAGGTVLVDAVGSRDAMLKASLQWEPAGVRGGALTFSRGYADLTWDVSLDASAGFAVALWVRLDAVTTPFERYFSSFWWSGESNGAMYLDNGPIASGIRCAVRLDSGWASAGSTDTVPPGAWHHVACMYGDGELGVYVDGAVVAATPATGVLMPSEVLPVAIGASVDADGTSQNSLNGTIDEIRVYGRALASDELAALAKP